MIQNLEAQMDEVLVLQAVLAVINSLAVVASWLMFAKARRERRMCSGMLAACREHRADCKRDAEQAKQNAHTKPNRWLL